MTITCYLEDYSQVVDKVAADSCKENWNQQYRSPHNTNKNKSAVKSINVVGRNLSQAG